jgi:peptide chain release factor 2
MLAHSTVLLALNVIHLTARCGTLGLQRVDSWTPGNGLVARGDVGACRVPSIDVAPVDVSDKLRDLDQTLNSIEAVLDLDRMRRELVDLNQQAAAPDLWDDQERAQKVTSRLSHVQAELSRVESLRRRLDDLGVLFELAEGEDDAATLAEAEIEMTSIIKSIGELEVRTLLSGEYDERDALITIRAEAGGVDAADFAEMLLRMYTRWAERHGYTTEVYDTSYAEEAGIKSATFAVKAPYSYGTLSVEQGTHRLVRISPFDNQGRRQTSFAGVEVVPVVEQSDHIVIPDDEIRVDVYRSSGPGGQGVNTTDSAVRITHLPTGIVVSCQNERSQLQNRASAMTVLQAKLLARRRLEEQAKINALKGDNSGSWGNQMRSYVLHPYQMVKDLRTEYETGNTAAVLDGEIDDFIEAGIRWRRTAEASA